MRSKAAFAGNENGVGRVGFPGPTAPRIPESLGFGVLREPVKPSMLKECAFYGSEGAGTGKIMVNSAEKKRQNGPTHVIHFPKFIAAALSSALIALPNVPLRRFRSKRSSLFMCPMMGPIAFRVPL